MTSLHVTVTVNIASLCPLCLFTFRSQSFTKITDAFSWFFLKKIQYKIKRKKMNERCVNCGVNFQTVKRSPLKNIPQELVRKLQVWLRHTVEFQANQAYICEPCIKTLRLKKERGNLTSNICLGCGTAAPKESFVLKGDQLRECRSWVPKSVAVNHLDKVCKSCIQHLTNHGTYKIKNVFVGIIEHENDDIKSEPESIEDVKSPVNESSDDDMSDNDLENGSNEEDSSNSDDEQNIQDDDGITDNDSDDKQNVQDDNGIKEDVSDHIEDVSVKVEPEYTDYEYLDESLIQDSNSKNKSKSKPKKIKKTKEDKDDDYVPPFDMSKIGVIRQPRSLIGTRSCPENETLEESTDTSEEPLMIELQQYKRTTRIGRCIFTGCTEQCVSLIPKTVRRKMLIEHNTYIPLLSKVCEEHLQDQNWEDISSTTNFFRADHCQDLKNIATQAAQTNFDFENIETVDSKLVRYWFDLNKAEFNRIFNLFPKLKRLKKGKTAFAVYLMRLQKTSVKRIALLLRMKETGVKRRISFVQDLVKCDSFKMFKDRFLDDD